MKQKLKKILILVFAILLIFTVVFVFKACTVEKQNINLKYNTKAYSSGTIETIVSVVDQNGNTKKSNLTLELLDNDNKKVKGIKERYKLEEGKVANCSLALPEDLEAGSYNLKLTARSGLITTKKTVSVNVSNVNNSEIIISLDKGIYKPGDTIQYRALVISKTGEPKASKEVTVEILDGNGNRVYSETSDTTEFGVVSGKFTLASEVNSGTYTISVDTNSKKVDKYFTVNPYITPQFEVSVATDKDVYKVGETANITFNAKYFFGEPVANAEVVGKIDDKEVKGLTDNSGNFVYSYQMKNKGKKDIEVSVTDTSNYMIEASKTLYAQEYAFEVETIFENGQINKNVNNDVYILAKKIDGTPVKVRANVTVGQIPRQVITDENGLGKFTLTAADTASLASTSVYQISAEDNEGNAFSSIADVSVVTSSIAISTDKIKYNQGEDIEVNLSSISDSGKRTVYVCKNGEIIKIVSTDSDKVKLNLEDVSGLVDIFVEGKTANTERNYDDFVVTDIRSGVRYNNYSYVRKTIFIKPNKSLDIAVSTDKEEYKPGENVNISFEVQDESKKSTDTNLLVSILDEAVLSLAENDLSMDNIRLALKDIELTDGITAADLYADILDDKSESNLMVALLKHNSAEPSSSESNIPDYYSTDYLPIISGLIIGLIVVAIIYVGISDSKKLQNTIKDVVNVFIIGIFVFGLFGNTLYDVFSNNALIKTLISVVALVLMIYCLALYKKRDKIFDLIIKLLIIPGIYALILSLIYKCTDYNDEIAMCGLFAVPLLMTILVVWGRSHKLNKFWNSIKELTILLVKAGIAYLIAIILTEMMSSNEICFILILILSYLLIERVYKAKVLKAEPPTKQLNIGEILAIGFFILIIVLVSSIIDNFSGSVIYEEPIYNDFKEDYTLTDDVGVEFDAALNTAGASSSSSGFDILGEMFSAGDSLLDKSNQAIESAEGYEDEAIIEDSTATEKEEVNVRNVFLESLAFIPSLVAEDGKANTQIKLSDNITTWNIQVVGNTKSGSIGSASSTFKVFKEFFVDFSLPTNSVVTDKTNIPVTIYNYKGTSLNVNLKVLANDWGTIGNYLQTVTVDANSTKLVYIPIEITKAGNNILRVEANAEGVSDTVERTFTVNPNGYKKTNVISSSTIEESFETDYFTTEQAIENTRKLKLKLYPSAISQAIEGMESIFRMPTGCFEQTSSSLYPNILALKYLEDNNLDNDEIRQKALEYISVGYQRLLTFEVPGVKGGYSLFGDDPAEPVITAFGLMELEDASEVYDVDEQVIENMKEYLYGEQKTDGSFDINATLETGTASQSDLAMNAYIIWALSEADSKDERIDASISYLENNLDKVEDNYTLGLIANAFSNVKNKQTKTVINKLLENVEETSDSLYVTSKLRDYYGSYGDYQTLQTTALASMALSKNNLHSTTNNSFIKYLVSHKDSFGNWGSTQATILSLKAINMASNKGKISGQTITASVNDEIKEIKVANNPLDIYEVEFYNIKDENKVALDIKKGNLCYELIEEYYVPYESIMQNEDKYKIGISETINSNVKVNDTITQSITITNNAKDVIANGLVTVNIPQGCSVNEVYLERAVALGVIEKYEYNYSTLNLYIRNFEAGESKVIDVYYRANYPEEISGGAIRAYDYYNPDVEGVEGPVKITVSE